MKRCPKCQSENDSQAAFCSQCGYAFADMEDREEIKASRKQKTGKKSMSWIAVTFLALVVIAAGVSLYFIFRDPTPNSVANSDTSTSQVNLSSSQTTEETSTSSSEKELSQYDDVIAKAKKLTINGDFKGSQLALATIPVSDLAKPDFSSIRAVVEQLQQENTAGLQAAEKNTDENLATGFTGDLAKWANAYTFYYSQEGQVQGSLSISANGGVTKNDYDGSQLFGKATIKEENETVLSYTTTELYPMEMPATKSINADVLITIVWDNGGGAEKLYGYLSYSSRLALTDGVTNGDGVNEVWISY